MGEETCVQCGKQFNDSEGVYMEDWGDETTALYFCSKVCTLKWIADNWIK